MAWTLVPCLVSLRAEFNELATDRDKASDGSIGDTAHAGAGNSDHLPDEDFPALAGKDSDWINEVHAIDVDKDLRRPGWTMQKCVEIIVMRHRTGKDHRLQNVIYNRRIWSRSWGWTARSYTGSNAHTLHAHFSARYTTAQERDTRHWGLLEADMALSAADKTWFTNLIKAETGAVPVKTWKVAWNGEKAEVRLAKAAFGPRMVTDLDVKMDAYAAADALRDEQDALRDDELPARVREALGAGQSPEQVAALLLQLPGVDWQAVAVAILGEPAA